MVGIKAEGRVNHTCLHMYMYRCTQSYDTQRQTNKNNIVCATVFCFIKYAFEHHFTMGGGWLKTLGSKTLKHSHRDNAGRTYGDGIKCEAVWCARTGVCEEVRG